MKKLLLLLLVIPNLVMARVCVVNFTSALEVASDKVKECNFEIIEWNYTYSSIEINYPTWTSKLLKFPRRLLYKLNPNLAVRTLGGASLMVLAK